MVTIRDKIALYGCFYGPAQVLGAGEAVASSGTSLFSVAKLSFMKIEELYHRFVSKNDEKKFDVQMNITTEFKKLNNRVYNVFMAIITIIPFGGIYRNRQAKKSDLIHDLLPKGNKQFLEGNFKESYKTFKEASKLGSFEADYYIALGANDFIKAGLITDKDEVSVRLHRAVKKGYSSAQILLTYHYDQSRVIANLPQEKDLKKAFELLMKAALQGNKKAMNSLGIAYSRGDGVTQSSELANYWYKQAMEKGDLAGQVNYACNLFDGIGVKKDEQEAAKLLNVAHKKGNKDTIPCMSERNIAITP